MLFTGEGGPEKAVRVAWLGLECHNSRYSKCTGQFGQNCLSQTWFWPNFVWLNLVWPKLAQPRGRAWRAERREGGREGGDEGSKVEGEEGGGGGGGLRRPFNLTKGHEGGASQTLQSNLRSPVQNPSSLPPSLPSPPLPLPVKPPSWTLHPWTLFLPTAGPLLALPWTPPSAEPPPPPLGGLVNRPDKQSTMGAKMIT